MTNLVIYASGKKAFCQECEHILWNIPIYLEKHDKTCGDKVELPEGYKPTNTRTIERF